MKQAFNRVTTNIGGGEIRREMLEGEEHVVVPAAMLAEGVWAGNNGPLLYLNEDLAPSEPTWNSKPVLVYHPHDEEGKPISGCDPSILNTRKIGVMLNSIHDDKLRTEAWINPKRADSVDKRIMEKINKKEIIECSTGLHSDNEDATGEFDGKPYEGIVRNIRGDHLAILPDKVGAYSRKDGGGVLQFNAAETQPESVQEMTKRTAAECLKKIGVQITDNELSFTDVNQQISELLAAKFGEPGKYWDGYICATYETYVVFSAPRKNVVKGGADGYSKFIVDYSTKDGVVSLGKTATEVKEMVQYRSVKGEKAYLGNESGQLIVQSMKGDKMSFDKKAHIDSLIQAGGRFTEEDREALEGTPDAVLQKFTTDSSGSEQTTNEDKGKKGKKAALVANAGEGETVTAANKKLSFTEYLENHATDADRDAINDMLTNSREQRSELVKAIVANSNGAFEEKDLSNTRKFDMATLKKLHKSLTANKRAKRSGPDDDDDDEGSFNRHIGIQGGAVDYSLNAGADDLTENEEAGLELTAADRDWMGTEAIEKQPVKA